MAKRKQVTNLVKHNLELVTVHPKTDNQEHFLNTCEDTSHFMLLGMAGTGKTFLALYKALQLVNEGKVNKITIFRSSVASRDLGFLPGTVQEKMSVFETPYRIIVNKLLGRDDGYDLLVKIGIISFESSSFQRGTTLDNQVVVIDEIQNMFANELDTLITRCGTNTRYLLCGDLMQQDLRKSNEKDVYKVINILKSLHTFNWIEFGLEDIVRSGMVKEYLINKYNMYPEGY